MAFSLNTLFQYLCVIIHKMSEVSINPDGIKQSEPSRILEVNKTLKGFTYEMVKPLLDAKHETDPVAGIVIVGLDGEEYSGDLKYHFHGARVLTSSPDHPNFVNPHFHKIGEEPYNILAGQKGEMNLGRVVNGEVQWQEPKIIQAGKLIEVQEGEVHSLRNLGEDPLDFTFACPDEHLIDNSSEYPQGDRYLTAYLPNGIPSHYPKTQ